MRLRSAAVLILSLAAGCAVGPDYEAPAPGTPAAWSAGSASAPDLARWWELFQDPVLSRLVEQALEANPDLKVATARVKRALALAGVDLAALLPTVEAGASYTRSRRSENAMEFPIDLYRSHYEGGFTARWEIDLFGGSRRALEAASADVEAAAADLDAVRVSLLGEVGFVYVTLRGQQRVLETLRQMVRIAKDTAGLTRSRMDAGVATSLDLFRAEAQAATAEAQLPTIEADLRRSMHRLGALLGRDPESLRAELEKPAAIPSAPPQVVVGVPSDVLRRRPDLRASERRLAAATARVGEAIGEYYPKLSLTGAFGLESLSSADFFKAGSRAWSLGPALRWPLFAGGRIRAQVRSAEAGVEEAAAGFERTVLLALEEVENALVSYLREGERRRLLEASVEASRRAAGLAGDLHRQGLASFLEVLEAQKVQFIAERDLALSEAAVTLNLVVLYKVLGGGWNPPAPPESK